MADTSLPSLATPPSLPPPSSPTIVSMGNIPYTSVKAVPGHPNVYPSGHIFDGGAYGYRAFKFILMNKLGGTPVTTSVYLNVNPEDFVLEQPYRMNAIQTMGAPFVDIWGQGIKRISLRGHTGLKTQVFKGQMQDGFDNFFTFKNLIVNQYHQLREQYASTYSQTYINSNLELTMIDYLDQLTYVLVPENFRFLRNKSRPQLFMYEASFIVLSDTTQTATNPNPSPDYLSQLNQNNQSQIPTQMTALNVQFSDLLSSITLEAAYATLINNLVAQGLIITSAMITLLQGNTDVSTSLAAIVAALLAMTQAIVKGLRSLTSYADLTNIALPTVLCIYNLTDLYEQLAGLLTGIASTGLETYTGIFTSSASVALIGMPTSTLSTSVNSFTTLATQDTDLAVDSNTTVVASTVASIINTISLTDTTLELVAGS